MNTSYAIRPVVTTSLKYLLLIVGAAIMLTPFAWMILSSMMTSSEILARPLTWFPAHPSFDAYRGLVAEARGLVD